MGNARAEEGWESSADAGQVLADVGWPYRTAVPLPAAGDLDRLVPYRIVVGFLLASLLWKLPAFVLCFQIYIALPLEDPFFPGLLRNNVVLGLAYLVPIYLSAIALASRERIFLRIQALVTCTAMLVLCVHQGTYNDVTFLTSWWTSLWCVWYVGRLDDPREPLAIKGVFLAQLILSLIFLGGAAGKWTDGYWSGEVFHERGTHGL
jgi:hypothetical protein